MVKACIEGGASHVDISGEPQVWHWQQKFCTLVHVLHDNPYISAKISCKCNLLLS